MRQCETLGIPFQADFRPNDYTLLVDGIFGFSFTGEIRPPFDSLIRLVNQRDASVPLVSIDLPSGWDVENGNVSGQGLLPGLSFPRFRYPQF